MIQQSIYQAGIGRLHLQSITPSENSSSDTFQLQWTAFFPVNQHGCFNRVKTTDQLKHFFQIFTGQVYTIRFRCLYRFTHHPKYNVPELGVVSQASSIQECPVSYTHLTLPTSDLV